MKTMAGKLLIFFLIDTIRFIWRLTAIVFDLLSQITLQQLPLFGKLLLPFILL